MKLRRLFAWSAGTVLVLAAGAFAFGWFTSTNACYREAVAPKKPMKAVIRCDYGTADVLRIADVETPVPAAGEVLVNVRVAAVNPLDWHYMRGTPYIMRLGMGLRRPGDIRLGVDFAGTVESVGPGVTRFKPGDAVFGGASGALAHYVLVREDRAIVHKPPELSFEQAATVGIAATTALQGLRDGGRLQPGDRVLINGASGGVGTYAVQIAHSLGAHVTGVCSTRNVALVRSLGADEVIDYKQADYTQGTARYDIILDNVGNRSLGENRRVLKPDGRYVLIGGGGPDDGRWVGPMLKPVGAWMLSWFVSQDMGMRLAHLNASDLGVLRDLMQTRRITPVIDRRYSMRDTADAIRYLETGRARGKVVIEME
ncbi:NAD(P)-dependent alcohol dehydrogenase [Lysobacter sp. LF1]|uniref:NAD(P)-dependent alcohol dehydrogenase n=1 Tax=Lysobacter stagni TaxID=3045172 RepID=A0ABT6XBC1_9GAMM|nr:NAD(P)-dependent alcohol dehydrogenase [Lysobacter sp. LF1]MDI9237442.1 NAD(P)-dependent alcohol dehydrogenase [Lysobacter sp. LF1]